MATQSHGRHITTSQTTAWDAAAKISAGQASRTIRSSWSPMVTANSAREVIAMGTDLERLVGMAFWLSVVISFGVLCYW